MDSGISPRGLCVSSQGSNERDTTGQQTQICVVVAGKFCMNAEKGLQGTSSVQWSPGLLFDSVNKALVDSFQTTATVKE